MKNNAGLYYIEWWIKYNFHKLLLFYYYSKISPEEVIMLTECVHHFIAPEIERKLIRNHIKIRQTKHIEMAHDVVYATMTDLQKLGLFPGAKGAIN